MSRRAAASTGRTGRGAIAGWLLFDFAAQPFYTLVLTFVFAPYFAARLAADPVEGQALWGFAAGAAGLLVAALAPPLGAVADAAGRRKPWIAAFSIMLVAGTAMLWFAAPGAHYAVAVALVGFVVASVGAEFATVFTNAMMPDLVPPDRLGRLSGTGWAAGYAGGLLALVVALGLLAADPDTGLTLLGLAPLFGLDPAMAEGDRAAGPLAALWYAVFVLPLFLLTPDIARRRAVGPAVREGLAGLGRTLAGLPRQRAAFRFLIAHMLYADGLVALFAFGGIYAASIFGWSAIELGLFGILLTVTGVAGGLIGGVLDDRLGPRAVVAGALVALIAASLGILSITADSIFFAFPVAPPTAGDGLFAAPAERAYLALGAVIGVVAGPLQASSRTLLVAVAPAGRITEFFGLFALSGKLTSFLGPFAVGALTAASGSQRVGISALIAFFVAGGAILSTIGRESA